MVLYHAHLKHWSESVPVPELYPVVFESTGALVAQTDKKGNKKIRIIKKTYKNRFNNLVNY